MRGFEIGDCQLGVDVVKFMYLITLVCGSVFLGPGEGSGRFFEGTESAGGCCKVGGDGGGICEERAYRKKFRHFAMSFRKSN